MKLVIVVWLLSSSLIALGYVFGAMVKTGKREEEKPRSAARRIMDILPNAVELSLQREWTPARIDEFATLYPELFRAMQCRVDTLAAIEPEVSPRKIYQIALSTTLEVVDLLEISNSPECLVGLEAK
jgi:hypothetical protein